MFRTNKRNISRWLLVAAALSCCFQIVWFGSRCFHQIDIDGIDYIGIARHLRDHQSYSAINDFRSPLLSWLIANGSFFVGDLVLVGKLLSIGSYLLCAALLYFFAKSLWHSDLAASLAVLWFSLSRGLAAQAVGMVTPDLLFAALTLVYFMVLLQCLRVDETKHWGLLGIIHALAFLAKGFALPWLALTTLVSVLHSRPRQQWAARLALAGILPLLVAATWAGVLHSKYGAFTTGTQFKFNFLQWTPHAYKQPPDPTYAVLKDMRPFVDEDNVGDPMPPGSALWSYRIDARQAVPALAKHEAHNLPMAVKELLIVVTPGGLMAFVFVVVDLARRRERNPVEFTLTAVVALGGVSLLLAYCMLVFDGRYLYPIIPLELAIAVGFLDRMGPALRIWRRAMIALIVLGILASLVYSSSPFRTLSRDFQVSCYRAGQSLRTHPGSTVVSIGSGPYQDHGVGWEAGYKSAYFGDRRLIGATEKLPNLEGISAILGDISKARPDAVLLWGRPGDARYEALAQQLNQAYGDGHREALMDPFFGEVGSAFYARPRWKLSCQLLMFSDCTERLRVSHLPPSRAFDWAPSQVYFRAAIHSSIFASSRSSGSGP
ncbi:MAG: ArnT family glycosyltransferase [Terriglobales bacterium]